MPGIVCVLRKSELVRKPQFLSEKINKKLVFSNSFKTRRINKKYLSMIITGHKNSIIRVIDSEKYIIGFVGENTTRNFSFATKLNTELDKKNNPIDIIKIIPTCSSLAVFNKKTKIFYHATDFVATKPVYFTETKEYFISSPEIFSLAAIDSNKWGPSIDYKAMAMSLTSGNGSLINNRTFLKNVKKLSAAEYIYYSNSNIKICEYDKLSFSDSNESTDEVVIDLKKSILKDLSTICDRNIGLCLSGGVDSRILLYCALKNNCTPAIISFCSVPKEKNRHNYEAPIASKICNKINIKHEILYVNYKNFMKEMDFAIKTMGGEANMVSSALISPFTYYKKLQKYDCLMFGDELWGWSGEGKNIRSLLRSILIPLFEDSDIVRCLKFNNSAKKWISRKLNNELIKIAKRYLIANSYEKSRDIFYWKFREPNLVQNYKYQFLTIVPSIPPLLFYCTLNKLQKVNDMLRSNKEIAYRLLKIVEPDDLKDIPFANTKDDYNYHHLIVNSDTRNIIKVSFKKHLSPFIEYFISKDNLMKFLESLFKQASSYDISKSNKKEINKKARKGLSLLLYKLSRFVYKTITKWFFLDKIIQKIFQKKLMKSESIGYYGKLVVLTRLFSLNETLNKYQKEFNIRL